MNSRQESAALVIAITKIDTSGVHKRAAMIVITCERSWS